MEVLSAETVQRLVRSKTQDQPVVSLYLNVDGRENVRVEDYCRNLDALLRSARSKETSKGAEADLDRIETFVRDEFERGNIRGLAIFSSGESLWEVVLSPLPVQNYVVIDSSPHVQRLGNVLDEYETTGVLISDKQRARLFVIELGRVVERGEVNTPQPRHDDDKGNWEKEHVKQHASAVAQQHVKAATQAMFELYQRRNFRHFVIGTTHELSSDLRSNLHSYLAQRLVGLVQMSVASSDDDIIALAWQLTQAAERASEAERIDRLMSLLPTGSSQNAQAVAGLVPTIRAVSEKRVEMLLVHVGFAAEGRRCTKCGYLSSTDVQCGMCSGATAPVDDVVEHVIERAVAQKCHVEYCHDADALAELGNIGAILRF